MFADMATAMMLWAFCLLVLSLSSSVSASTTYRHECIQKFIFEGFWEHNNGEDLHKGRNNMNGLSNDQQAAMRYQSLFQDLCGFSDYLKASTERELIRGHLNEEIESQLFFRLKALRGKTWFTLGTSVDHSVTRLVCPLFGSQETVEIFEDDSDKFYMCHCRLPKLDVNIAYSFAGPIAFNFTESKVKRVYEKIHNVFGNMTIMKQPAFITLAGIEWDLKLNRNITKLDFRNAALSHLNLLYSLWPNALFSLRSQYYSSGRKGAYAEESKLLELNEAFYEISRESYHRVVASSRSVGPIVLLSDLKAMMRHGGAFASGWTDGMHPGHWVTLQYVNFVLHQVNDALVLFKRA